MIDDPYMFGRIAAHHSLNDIYAMAAQPTAALAFVTVPLMAPRMIEEELFQVLSGAVSVLNTASVPLRMTKAEGAELGVALTVTGNGSGRALTKGLSSAGRCVDIDQGLRHGGIACRSHAWRGRRKRFHRCHTVHGSEQTRGRWAFYYNTVCGRLPM